MNRDRCGACGGGGGVLPNMERCDCCCKYDCDASAQGSIWDLLFDIRARLTADSLPLKQKYKEEIAGDIYDKIPESLLAYMATHYTDVSFSRLWSIPPPPTKAKLCQEALDRLERQLRLAPQAPISNKFIEADMMEIKKLLSQMDEDGNNK
jgi:hypothetical protein